MRLIDADELCEDVDNYEFTEHSDYSNVRDIIDYAPTIDAEPVKHGEWEQVDDNKCKCTNCGTVAFIALYPNGANNNYCPNCGARMDGESK